MIWLAVILALFGAGANALGTVLQKLSAEGPDPAQLFSRKFIRTMVTHRLWLGGVACDSLGFLFQAGALYVGSLVVVEPVLTIDLVILFLIAHFYFRAKAGRSGWAGALLVSGGLAGFLLATDPRGGHNAASGWWIVIAVAIIAAIVLLAAIAMLRVKSDKTRVIVGAFATGLNFSLSAIFTKLAMSDLSHGLVAMLTGWPVYAMIVSAATALVIMQSTYASGSLKLSQPIITIAGPLSSVIIGVVLFDTSLRTGWLALGFAAVSVLAIVAGILLLAGSRTIIGFHGNKSL